jgi:hypothetical protein
MDTQNSQASFYLSLLLLQENKIAPALKTWTKLIQKEPSSSKWIKMLIPQIENLSANFSAKLSATQETDLFNIRLIFLDALETLEQKVEENGETIEIWASVIRCYKNLAFAKKVETSIEKMRLYFSLSSSQIEQLEKIWTKND